MRPVDAASTNQRFEDEGLSGRSVYDRIRAPAEGRDFKLLIALIAKAVKIIWQVAPRQLSVATAVQVMAAVAAAVQLVFAREVLAQLIPMAGHHLRVSAVLPYFAGLAGATAIAAFATTVQSELTLLIGELVGRRAVGDVADAAGAVDLEAFERPGFYDRLERAHFNAMNRNMAAVTSFLGLISSLLATIAIAAVLLAVAPLIVPLILADALPVWLVSARNSREHHAFQTRMTTRNRERRYLLEAITGREYAKEIRSFDLGWFLRRRHDRLYDDYVHALGGLVRSRLRRALLGDLVASCAILATLGLLVWLIEQHRLTVADAGTAVFAVLFVAQRMRALIGHAAKLYESSLFLQDVSEFAALRPPSIPAHPHRPAPSGFHRLVVEDVSFTYPAATRSCLRNVSLEIGAGEVVALVGENGSGKTTLAKQLAALHTPTAGRILWDGVDVSKCDPYELRRSITVIFQDFVRWALSAADNIGMGDSARMHDRQSIIDAARRSGIDHFVSQLPNGYDTVLSRFFEAGCDLSIGQWQRVALARTLFRDAPLVIMDEPTAALDPLAEYRIFEAIRAALSGRSVLFISHRFSSVRIADRIFVLDDGQIIERGTHEELMALGGRYALMFNLQAAAYLGHDLVST